MLIFPMHTWTSLVLYHHQKVSIIYLPALTTLLGGVEAISIANITTKTVVHTMHQLRLTPPHISLPMLTLHSTPNLMFSSGNIPLENPYSTLTKCYPMDYKAQGVGLETCMAWVDYINCIVVSASL